MTRGTPRFPRMEFYELARVDGELAERVFGRELPLLDVLINHLKYMRMNDTTKMN